jgi:uncharacterized membrane protein YqiK
MKAIYIRFFSLLAASLFMTGCYINEEVAANQVAVQLDEGRIVSVVGAGVYTDMGFWSDLKVMGVDTLTFSVEDPEVLTSDNQPVGVKITIQARRKADKESVENIYTKWSSLTTDEVLVNTISATAREGMKNGTRGFTLTVLLNDRNKLADEIRKSLESDAAKYSVEIVNVTVENISISESYAAILSETANINAETDKEKRRQDLINQQAANQILEQEQRVKVANAQLLAEQAETGVQVEIAKRAGEIVAASNQVYVDNPQAFELRRLEMLSKILGDKSVIYYLPSDATLTLLQNVGNITPVPSPVVPPTGEQQ